MTDTRGGKREGAGRKAHTKNEKAIARFERALRKAKRKHGESWEDMIADLCYSPKKHLAIQALKLTAEIIIGKQSKQDVSIDDKREEGPIVIPDLYEREPEEEKEKLLN